MVLVKKAFLILILLASFSYATVDQKYALTHCGDGIREGYEICEPDTTQNLCPVVGEMLKIAMVCDFRDCTCLPKIKDCGNQLREGAEMCDPGTKEAAEDFCPKLGDLLGHPLKCNPESCFCQPDGDAYVVSKCGDTKVEGPEECEEDSDCGKGACTNCTCIMPPVPLEPDADKNFTPAPKIPTVNDITNVQTPPEKIVFGFDLEEFIGEKVPEELELFEDERTNIVVSLKNGSSKTVGVITIYGVVQEINPDGYGNPTLTVYASEENVDTVKSSSEKSKTIRTMFENEALDFKAKNIFRRMWHALFNPFR